MKQSAARSHFLIAVAFLSLALGGCARSDKIEYVNSAVWTRAYDIEIQENYAFCSFQNGLGVLDITNKAEPRLLSKLFLGGGFGIEVENNTAYLAAGVVGLQIVDVSDPAVPVLVGGHATLGEAKDIALAGDHVFVADGPSGVMVADVSDPTAPEMMGLLDTPGSAESILLSGNFAYVADGQAGLMIIDVTTPSSPVLIGEFDTPGNAEDVALTGNYAYVVDGSSGIHVVDVSTPSEPRRVSSVEAAGYAHGITIHGDYAFVGNMYDADFEIFDISDPTAPTQSNTLKYAFPNEGWDVATDGEYAYIVDHFSGIFVVDIANMANPEVLGAYRTPSFLVGLEINDDRAFSLGQEFFGLTIVDISDPAEPAFASRFDADFSLRFPAGVASWDNYAYVTERRRSAIVDIGTPTEPSRLTVIPVPETARAVQVRDDYAYVTADNAGFFVMNVSDPSNVVIAGSVEMPGFSYGVALSGDYAYVANSEYGLKVMDITDPTAPSLVSSLQTPDNAYSLAVDGNHVYIADGESGLQVVDISDPTSPIIVGSIDLGGFINSVALSGDIAYVTDEDFGVRKLDISDPARPLLIASYDTPGEPTDIAVVGEYVIVNDAFSLIVLKSN